MFYPSFVTFCGRFRDIKEEHAVMVDVEILFLAPPRRGCDARPRPGRRPGRKPTTGHCRDRRTEIASDQDTNTLLLLAPDLPMKYPEVV